MTNKQLFVLAIVLVLLCTFLLIRSVFFNQQMVVSDLTQNESPSHDTRDGENTYTNTQYKFSIEFPQNWIPYTVENDAGAIDLFGIEPTLLSFLYKGEKYFRIWVFTQEEWLYLTTEERLTEMSQGGPLPDLLMTNEEFVIASSIVEKSETHLNTQYQSVDTILKSVIPVSE